MRIAIVTRQKPNRFGEIPLYVRIQHGRTVYVSLGLSIKPADWNPRRREIRASYGPGADKLNELLAEREQTARDAALAAILRHGRDADADVVKAAVEEALHPEPEEEDEPTPGFLAFARDEVRRTHEDRGGISAALAYGSALNNFEAFLVEEGFRVGEFLAGDVTASLARRFARWLAAEEPRGRGHRPNYVAKQLAVVRWALGRAVEAGHPGADLALRQAKAVKIKRERVARDRLTLDQVQEMLTMDLQGRAADVRDWFVFAFLAGGLRFSDVCRLRWAHLQRDTSGRPEAYTLRQTKTGEPLTLPLVPEAADILERWEARTGPTSRKSSPFVFGLIEEAEEADPARLRTALSRRGALARKYLRQICEEKKWPVVGTHGARHGLADHLRKEGADLYAISKVLGHASVRITEAYLKGFDEEVVGRTLVSALSSKDRSAGTPREAR